MPPDKNDATQNIYCNELSIALGLKYANDFTTLCTHSYVIIRIQNASIATFFHLGQL